DGFTDTPHTDPDHARERLRTALAATAHDTIALALHQITTACLTTAHPNDDSAVLLAHLAAADRR
ncbi:hypothetical protein, partial [Streptomyces sp. MBT33]